MPIPIPAEKEETLKNALLTPENPISKQIIQKAIERDYDFSPFGNLLQAPGLKSIKIPDKTNVEPISAAKKEAAQIGKGVVLGGFRGLTGGGEWLLKYPVNAIVAVGKEFGYGGDVPYDQLVRNVNEDINRYVEDIEKGAPMATKASEYAAMVSPYGVGGRLTGLVKQGFKQLPQIGKLGKVVQILDKFVSPVPGLIAQEELRAQRTGDDPLEVLKYGLAASAAGPVIGTAAKKTFSILQQIPKGALEWIIRNPQLMNKLEKFGISGIASEAVKDFNKSYGDFLKPLIARRAEIYDSVKSKYSVKPIIDNLKSLKSEEGKLIGTDLQKEVVDVINKQIKNISAAAAKKGTRLARTPIGKKAPVAVGMSLDELVKLKQQLQEAAKPYYTRGENAKGAVYKNAAKTVREYIESIEPPEATAITKQLYEVNILRDQLKEYGLGGGHIIDPKDLDESMMFLQDKTILNYKGATRLIKSLSSETGKSISGIVKALDDKIGSNISNQAIIFKYSKQLLPSDKLAPVLTGYSLLPLALGAGGGLISGQTEMGAAAGILGTLVGAPAMRGALLRGGIGLGEAGLSRGLTMPIKKITPFLKTEKQED